MSLLFVLNFYFFNMNYFICFSFNSRKHIFIIPYIALHLKFYFFMYFQFPIISWISFFLLELWDQLENAALVD